MRKFWLCALMAAGLASCETLDHAPEQRPRPEVNYGEGLTHDMIVLGDRLDNPYKKSNVRRALASLYPTKASSIDLPATDLYVRFLPESDAQLQQLLDLGLELVDHPLDYQIKVEGDWYHDPEFEEEEQTWQYAVLPHDCDLPGDVFYEVIDECILPDHVPVSKAVQDIDWEAVEREAYVLTGNEEMLLPETKAPKDAPAGRITIVDPAAHGGKEFGVAGVRVTCNSFVRMDKCYTDRDGYFEMKKKFSSRLRYRMVYKNEKGFSIGFNRIFTPASVSTLGKGEAEGLYFTVTPESEEKMYRRCCVNNAAYDYYRRCERTDMNIALPPADLRLWIFPTLASSSAAMLHHGTLLSDAQMGKFWGYCLKMVKYFLPDITIGTKNQENYASIYASVCHELAHSSHYTQVGTDYWNQLIHYIVSSFVTDGGHLYGDGTGLGAGESGVSEMWAYYLSSEMFQERYGGAVPAFGSDFWFHPQIFRALDERGIHRSDIFRVLQEDVVSEESLKYALMAAMPYRRSLIEQVFNRYH